MLKVRHCNNLLIQPWDCYYPCSITAKGYSYVIKFCQCLQRVSWFSPLPALPGNLWPQLGWLSWKSFIFFFFFFFFFKILFQKLTSIWSVPQVYQSFVSIYVSFTHFGWFNSSYYQVLVVRKAAQAILKKVKCFYSLSRLKWKVYKHYFPLYFIIICGTSTQGCVERSQFSLKHFVPPSSIIYFNHTLPSPLPLQNVSQWYACTSVAMRGGRGGEEGSGRALTFW